MRASRHVVVLGLRWLDTAWDFPSTRSLPIQSSVKPEHSKTPSLPQNVLGNCGTLSPTFRAFASSREIPDPCFLDCGGWTPLWICHRRALFPSKAPSSRSTPRHPHGHKTSWVTAELYPQPFAPSRLRVRLRILVSWTAVAGHRFGFPIDALSPHPKLRQAGALQDTLIATKRLG
jgi:hypothetical protein